ncbi:MAG TPA: hypothetical protein VIC27_07895, partial [Ktedonobacterales bacterium]
MGMRGNRHILRWLAPSLAACAVLMLGVFLVAAGILPGNRATAMHNTASASACTSKFSVSPTSGTVGTRFTAQGSAWPAGKSVGVYLVDPSHRLRPITLQLLTVPQSGVWNAHLTVPGAITFRAVGDETTAGGGAPQTINQTVSPGSYLVYAAAGDAHSFDTASVCPVKFAVLSSSGSAMTSPSDTTTSALHTATPTQSHASLWNAWAAWLGGGAFATLLLLMCAALALFRARILAFARRHRRALAGKGRRISLAVAALSLALFMILATLPPEAHAGGLQATSAMTTSTLYSDDFEGDAIGAFPVGWSIEAGANWSVQQNGSHALAQTSANASAL